MYGSKSWMIPVVVWIVLIANILLGMYQINFHKNPWDSDESYITSWEFIERK
jgi:hypothetical protein